jgi:hypothetical protein
MENSDMTTAKIGHGYILKVSKSGLPISSDAMGYDIGGKRQEQNSKKGFSKVPRVGLAMSSSIVRTSQHTRAIFDLPPKNMQDLSKRAKTSFDTCARQFFLPCAAIDSKVRSLPYS